MYTRYQKRTYRSTVEPGKLVSYEIHEKETDILVRTDGDFKNETGRLVRLYRKQIEDYITAHPGFAETLVPFEITEGAPPIIFDMAKAGREAGVGPMAAIAGTVAEYIGKDLLKMTDEVILENGGDIYLSSKDNKTIAIFAGESPLNMKIGIEIPPEKMPMGICTSSGTVGHSLSFGKADAAVVLSRSAALADAVATAVGNRVKDEDDIQGALEWALNINGISGAVIIIKDKLGTRGDLQLVRL